MKIKSKSKKPLIITSLIITAIAVTTAIAFIYNANHTSVSDTTSGKSSSNNNPKPGLGSNNSPDTVISKDTSPNTDQPTSPTPDASLEKQRVEMVASVDSSDNIIYIRGGANYPVPSEGTCYVNLTGPSGQIIRKNTTLLQNPNSTDCKTISIPTSELSAGNWSAKLHYSSNTYEGDSSEVTFSIK